MPANIPPHTREEHAYPISIERKIELVFIWSLSDEEFK